jgi:hypothetical protein
MSKAGASGSGETLALLAAKELAARKLRESFLAADLFSEPAWDMLLKLFLEETRGKSPSQISLITPGPRSGTMSRWLNYLASIGLIARDEWPGDDGVGWKLTKTGSKAIRGWLKARADLDWSQETGGEALWNWDAEKSQANPLSDETRQHR